MLHIGISGPIASGKSTLAQALMSLAVKQGYQAEIVPFATGLKEIASTAFTNERVPIMANWIQAWGKGTIDEMKAHWAALMIDSYMIEYPSTPGIKNRKLLQLIGTEIGREFLDESFWIYRTKDLLKRNPVLDYGISDDVRFDNEVMACDIHIGITLDNDRIDCYRDRVKMFDTAYMDADHVSEKSLTLPSLLTIPVCFTDAEVGSLYAKLDYMRRIR